MARKRRNKNKRVSLKIVERKLGKENAVGLHWPGDHLIEIDPRQTSREYLDTLIHESLHEIFPNASETTIMRAAGTITDVLWRCNYRRIMK